MRKKLIVAVNCTIMKRLIFISFVFLISCESSNESFEMPDIYKCDYNYKAIDSMLILTAYKDSSSITTSYNSICFLNDSIDISNCYSCESVFNSLFKAPFDGFYSFRFNIKISNNKGVFFCKIPNEKSFCFQNDSTIYNIKKGWNYIESKYHFMNMNDEIIINTKNECTVLDSSYFELFMSN